VLGFGKAGDVRNGADSVAASVVASALAFGFLSSADAHMRAQLRAESARVDRAAEELAALGERLRAESTRAAESTHADRAEEELAGVTTAPDRAAPPPPELLRSCNNQSDDASHISRTLDRVSQPITHADTRNGTTDDGSRTVDRFAGSGNAELDRREHRP
jgi:hypothetical protein